MDGVVTILVAVAAVLGVAAAVLLVASAVRSMGPGDPGTDEATGEFTGLAAEEDAEEANLPKNERLASQGRAIAREAGWATAEAFLREEGRLSAEEARWILGRRDPAD